jgi:dimethylargininase
MIALTHSVTPSLARCELTFLAREPIDLARARAQHGTYRKLLGECGAIVRELSTSPDHPDAVFVEDTAVVLDELAVVASMGVASRHAEVQGMRGVLAEYRDVAAIAPPATLEGGDVLRVGRRLFVGLTGRTNAAGANALERLVAPHGYRVVRVPVRGCLHLKSACTALDDDTLLANPAIVALEPFAGVRVVRVPDDEPRGANALRLGGTVCLSAAFPRTAELVARLGFDVRTTDISEFEKAEAAMTCLSLLLA